MRVVSDRGFELLYRTTELPNYRTELYLQIELFFNKKCLKFVFIGILWLQTNKSIETLRNKDEHQWVNQR